MNQNPDDLFDPFGDLSYDPLDPFGDFQEVFGHNGGAAASEDLVADPIACCRNGTEPDTLTWDSLAFAINPATGLLMSSGDSSGFDSGGSPYGVDSHSSSVEIDSSFHDTFGSGGFSWD